MSAIKVSTTGGATGSAIPTRAVQVGGSDGTNLRAIKVSTTGVVSVDGTIAVTNAGTFVTQDNGELTMRLIRMQEEMLERTKIAALNAAQVGGLNFQYEYR